MRNRWLGSMIVLVGVFFFAGPVFAQTDAKTAATPVSPRDFSGVWASTAFSGEAIKSGAHDAHINEAPETFLQPWALAQLKTEPLYLRKDLYASHTEVGSADQPVLCSQIALTDFITKVKPLEFVHTPQRIFMIFEYQHTFRTIWMDGRPLPKDPDPSYFGESVGRWEGNTLVVETVGFNDRTLINGMPHSDAAHLVERYTRKGKNIEFTFTADDSKAYTKPFTVGPMELEGHPDWTILENFCLQEDNDALQKALIDPMWKGVPVPGAAPNGK
jgi:hypothetical protein